MSTMVLHEAGLEFRSDEGEPRIRDLDLAERLGYERPRKIREIIREAQKVNGFGVCPVSGRTPGTEGGRPSEEYWLTERQALFVTTRSGTEKAAEATMLLVDAFLAVREQIRRDEQALKTIPRRLIEALLLPKPAEEWERMFQPSLVRALCDLHGVRWAGGSHPRFLSSTNRKIYDLVLSSEIGAEIKRRNPLPKWGANHHQQLTPEARDYLTAQLKIVEAIARQSDGKSDFWKRMEREYAGGMLQMSLSRGD
jgi:hypothetical protein